MSDHYMNCSCCRRIRRLRMELDFADADHRRSADELCCSEGRETVRRQNARYREVKRLSKKLCEAKRLHDETMADFRANPYQCSFYKHPVQNAPVAVALKPEA
jgi:hypothetical protein